MGGFSLDTPILFNFELCESISIWKVKLQIQLSERWSSESQYQINSTYWQYRPQNSTIISRSQGKFWWGFFRSRAHPWTSQGRDPNLQWVTRPVVGSPRGVSQNRKGVTPPKDINPQWSVEPCPRGLTVRRHLPKRGIARSEVVQSLRASHTESLYQMARSPAAHERTHSPLRLSE